ncbi:MAG TPA: putative addiction module antidote protein [Pseudobdellovibrionaceae bacterium]|nr:putative addiction module antidote protein [Pseudobdellovibrionaceae bacterium]
MATTLRWKGAVEEKLSEELKRPKFAAEYLAAAMEEGGDEFLEQALARVIRAHGMSRVAEMAGMSRQAVHKMLSSNGNPSFRNVVRLLSALGLKIRIVRGA